MENGLFARIRSIWKGRADRREYWLSLVCLFVAEIVLRFACGSNAISSFLLLPVFVLIAARRLHDFNAGAQWSLIPFGSGFVLGFLRSFMKSYGDADFMASKSYDGGVGLVSIAFMLAIGIWPGSVGPNRFGPSKASAKEALTG